MRDTIKKVDGQLDVVETLDRSRVCATETPQVFVLERILAAYRRVVREGIAVTDDAQAMEACGWRVRLVAHDGDNRKITFPADLGGVEP
jgi:2-C-methyl-D-erythritol 4-phosphate cytidylyltransferase